MCRKSASADTLARMNIQGILSELHSQRTRLDRAISALEGLAPEVGPGRPAKSALSGQPGRAIV